MRISSFRMQNFLSFSRVIPQVKTSVTISSKLKINIAVYNRDRHYYITRNKLMHVSIYTLARFLMRPAFREWLIIRKDDRRLISSEFLFLYFFLLSSNKISDLLARTYIHISLFFRKFRLIGTKRGQSDKYYRRNHEWLQTILRVVY